MNGTDEEDCVFNPSTFSNPILFIVLVEAEEEAIRDEGRADSTGDISEVGVLEPGESGRCSGLFWADHGKWQNVNWFAG